MTDNGVRITKWSGWCVRVIYINYNIHNNLHTTTCSDCLLLLKMERLLSPNSRLHNFEFTHFMSDLNDNITRMSVSGLCCWDNEKPGTKERTFYQ